MISKKIIYSPAIIAFILVAPIFFLYQNGLQLASGYSSSTIGALLLPLSSIIIPLLLVIFLLSHEHPRVNTKVFVCGVGLILCYTAGYLLGGFLSLHEFDDIRPLGRFLQSLYPLLALFFGSILAGSFDEKKRIFFIINFFEWGAKILLFIIFMYVCQTAISGSDTRFAFIADHIGPFYNPKIKRFFPSIIAIFGVYSFGVFYVSLVDFKKIKTYHFLIFTFMFISLFLFWSRSAVFSLLVGSISVFFMAKNVKAKCIISLMAFCSALFLPYILDEIIEVSNPSSSVYRTANTVQNLFGLGGEYNYGDDVRVERIASALQGTLNTPFGTGYELFNQRLFPVKDILIAENGYLDIGVRGGVLAIVFLIALIFFCLKASKSLVNERFSVEGVSIFSVLVSIFFGGLIWLNMLTEFYFGFIAWFLLGYISTLHMPAMSRS